MKDFQISIIIPVYKIEAYIEMGIFYLKRCKVKDYLL